MIYTPENSRGLAAFDLDGVQLKRVVEADTTKCILTEWLLGEWKEVGKGMRRETFNVKRMVEFDIVHTESGKIVDRARFAEVPRGPAQP